MKVLDSDGKYADVDVATYYKIKFANVVLNRATVLWIVTLIVWWYK